MNTIHILVKGKVQGVFFRATAREVATDLGLTGWVRNTDEGNVELTVTGGQETLDKFVQWCHTGPQQARVAEIVCNSVAPHHFSNFSVLR